MWLKGKAQSLDWNLWKNHGREGGMKMHRKRIWKRCVGIFAAAALMAGTVSCGQADQSGPTEEEQVTQEEQENQEEVSAYEPTEENDNLELVMNVQPESSYWFPAELLEWKAQEDEDLAFNISTVPLADRVDREKLKTVNETQNRDTQVMAISIMNASTSGNPPRGLNKVDCNAFSYWQYVDTLVYWGGSSGEGLIVAPSPDVVDAGHKNGVKVTGTIFFPQAAHGGKMEWLNTFLQKDEQGNFPIVDKLIEVADTYGFDGWFLNQESEGTEEEPLTAEHAHLMRELIARFQEKAPGLTLIYYDSMTEEGKMDWQNALTDANASFLKDAEGAAGADSMFLNFWWTLDELADQELLKASAEKAREIGVDPYALFAGVDVQSDGYGTPIRWNLFEESKNSTYTSLGLYCPNWAYSSASDMENFWGKENAMWVNSKGDPSENISYSSDTQWRGVSNYAVERTAVTSIPFTTNFCMGNGYSFFVKGEQVSKLDWNNRSISDILPTYRWMMEHEGNNSLSAGMDVATAYYGGNSLKLRGNMEKGKNSLITLYSASLPITDQVMFTTTAKSNAPAKLDAVVELEDGSTLVLPADLEIGADWTTVNYDTAALAGKTIRSLAYQISAAEDESDFEFHFGNITIADKEQEAVPEVSEVKVLEKEFDEDAVYAGARLSWQAETPGEYYEVYRVNQNGSKSLLGVTNTTNFYINTLPRTDDSNLSNFEVIPITKLLTAGKGAQATMEWPDNSIPRAGFAADRTLIAPGESVSFTSLCSVNTENVEWSFPGADTESGTENTATVTYSQEGVYTVGITAKNSSGTVEKEEEGYIVVSGKASEGLEVLSQGAKTEASSYVNENEAPLFAVDGDVTKKWCATGAAPHQLTIDLGEARAVSAVDISNAEAGGEGSDMNTKSYTIEVSEDGVDYREVVNITRNTLGTTHDTFAPVKARYVRLNIIKPTQGSDSAARIYEVQVYGLKEAL